MKIVYSVPCYAHVVGEGVSFDACSGQSVSSALGSVRCCLADVSHSMFCGILQYLRRAFWAYVWSTKQSSCHSSRLDTNGAECGMRHAQYMVHAQALHQLCTRINKDASYVGRIVCNRFVGLDVRIIVVLHFVLVACRLRTDS